MVATLPGAKMCTFGIRAAEPVECDVSENPSFSAYFFFGARCVRQLSGCVGAGAPICVDHRRPGILRGRRPLPRVLKHVMIAVKPGSTVSKSALRCAA